MQLLAEEIIAAPATSLAGLRAPLGGTSGQLLPRLCVRFSGRIMLSVRCGRRDDRPHADGARARGQARGRCGVQGWWRVASRTDAPLRSGRTGLSNARVDAARNAQHGAAMIAEGLKVVCVQRVDEGLSSKAPSGVLLAAPRPPRDFGNSVDHEKSVRPFKGIFCRDISEFESYMPSHAVRSPSAKMRVVPTLPIHWRVVECLGGLEAMAIIPVALPLQRSRAVRSPQRPSIMSLTSWAGSQGPLMFNHVVLRRPASCFDRRIRSRLPRRQLRPLPLCSRGLSCEPIRRPFPCQAHTQGSNAHFRVSLRNRKS